MKFLKSKIFYIILILILVLGGIYLVWKSKSKNEYQQVPQPEAADMYEYREEQDEGQVPNNIATEEGEYQVYTNSKYSFSFKYPKGFTVTNFQEGEYGETILVNKQGSKDSFQIFISPFDEPGPLTKERILADVPDMKIENPEQRLLKNGVPGLIFFSEEASLGKTREVWFIYPVRSSDSNGAYNGYLYQISTLAELDKWLAEILSTWKFH